MPYAADLHDQAELKPMASHLRTVLGTTKAAHCTDVGSNKLFVSQIHADTEHARKDLRIAHLPLRGYKPLTASTANLLLTPGFRLRYITADLEVELSRFALAIILDVTLVSSWLLRGNKPFTATDALLWVTPNFHPRYITAERELVLRRFACAIILGVIRMLLRVYRPFTATLAILKVTPNSRIRYITAESEFVLCRLASAIILGVIAEAFTAFDSSSSVGTIV
jgi:hypothetical protein